MRVAIFETEHPEVAYPLIRLFDNQNNQLTIFSYPEAHSHLKFLLRERYNDYTWIIKKENQSKISFIYRIYRESKKRKTQILYLNTISDNFIFYAIMILCLRKIRVILTIHAINNFFDHKFAFNLRRIVRTIGKKVLIKAVKEFNVISIPSKKYLEQKLPGNKKVYCIPNAIFEKTDNYQKQPEISQKINIVIPGSIEKRRRDYYQAFELAEQLKKQNIPYNITLLGRLCGDYGKEIREMCNLKNASGYYITYYNTADVEQQEFDSIMSQATIVFMPLKIHTIFDDDIVEICGTSSTSGNITEVIRHAKPFIIPKEIALDPILEESCFRYVSVSNIAEFIYRIYHKKEYYQELLKKAEKASEHFTIKKIRARNAGIFQ